MIMYSYFYLFYNNQQIGIFSKGIIEAFNDPKEEIIRAAWDAMDSLVKSITEIEMSKYVSVIRQDIVLVGRKIRQKYYYIYFIYFIGI